VKRLLLNGLALSILAGSALAQQAATPAAATAGKPPAFKAHVLTRPEFDALLANPARLVVIDVRRPDELTSKGGYPVYLSIQAADLEKRLDWIPRDRRIVTVSNHAARAGKSADLLTSKGFDVAGAIGVESYEQEGGTLTRIAAPATAAAPAATH
jgi:rhodanese-related sulfurtransferase